jgi:adenosylcobinamide-GDP ribazoletransferase
VRIAGLALLAAAAPRALLWAEVWGRIAPLVAMQAFPYLREPSTGTAAFHRAHWRGWWAELVPSALVLAGLTALAHQPFCWIGVIPALLVPLELGRRLGGHSGDSYGACVEWTVSWSLLLMGLISWRLTAAA